MWAYICTRVGAFCLFLLSNPSSTCVCLTNVFFTPACVGWGELEVGSWLALVAGVGGYVLAGVEIGVLSYVFLYFGGF